MEVLGGCQSDWRLRELGVAYITGGGAAERWVDCFLMKMVRAVLLER